MRAWTILLGGLAVWAMHFFTLYAVASVWPGLPEARWLAAGATLLALIGNGLIVRSAIARRNGAERLERWIVDVGLLGSALSVLAVVWQTVPVLLI